MKTAEEALEFNRIEEELDSYLSFEQNREEFHGFGYFTNPSELAGEHSYLKEGEKYFNLGNELALSHVFDLTPSLSLLEKDGNLSVQELADFIPFLSDAKIFSSLASLTSLPLLSSVASKIQDYSWIQNRLSGAILPDLSIADGASDELYSIRSQIKKLESSIGDALKGAASKYGAYLTDVRETIKGGLPSLAVKSSFKGKVKGMVSDISNTKETTYIVPIEVLEIQNKIFELKEEEAQEIERILKELSGLLKQNIAGIRQAYISSKRLDSVLGRVRFGRTYEGSVAEYGDEILLQDLSHPLLNVATVVRNNFHLGGKNAKILVISGPNAGGKTVLIKAVTLVCVMNQKGLLVSARGEAILPLFDSFFFLSGDSQSIMDSLSTFSGHVAALKEGIDSVGPKSLFVVDEIGQGTAPLDGEGIGVAVIDYLKKVGCYAIFTSHYDGMKDKAFKDPQCLVGAMIFDEKTIKPTFRYQENMIGKSYALEVASNLGLKQEIIDGARAYVEKRNRSEDREVLEKTMALQQENLRLKEEYEAKIREADDLLAKRQKALDGLTSEKEAIHNRAEEKLESMLNQKEKEIEVLYQEHGVSLKQLADIKGKMKEINLDSDRSLGKFKPREEQKKTHVFEVGDYVRVNSLNNSGIITKLNVNHNSAYVKIGGMEIKVAVSNLTFLSKGNEKKPEVQIRDSYIVRKTSLPLECNLIGLRRDEAREKLDKYLDDCILMKMHQVRIIHGNGSGALRTMVQDYLKKNPNVESFRFGGEGEGGVGATVVTLKNS